MPGAGWLCFDIAHCSFRVRQRLFRSLREVQGATDTASVFVRLVPLIPFVIPDLSIDTRFVVSAAATASAFFGVGAAKGAVLHRSALRSGLETLLTGGGAALLAYVVGAWLRAAFGAS